MKCAIIILNWNGEAMLRRYLPSVVEESKVDIIVADNGSTDDSLAVLKAEFPTVMRRAITVLFMRCGNCIRRKRSRSILCY